MDDKDIRDINELSNIMKNTSISVSDENLRHLITNCEYIANSTSTKKKDISSLSYLIDIEMSQSECIRLGIGCEKLISDLIMKYANVINIKKKNEKDKKEKDHLFMDRDNKVIYYAEIKSNINLDTEKLKVTYKKCQDIVLELKEEYSEYEIKWCLVALRYLEYDNIPNTIKSKYSNISENLYGINDYLKLLDIHLIFTQEIYKTFLNNIAISMFKT
jgi:hypothetical protein